LPPFFFPPFAAFFAMEIPPLRVVWRNGFYRTAMLCLLARKQRARGAFASLRTLVD
jgi:hypothetical protein